MRVRDAVEADADAMARLTEQPADVMRNLVHDRTVRVAVEGSNSSGKTTRSVASETESDPDESTDPPLLAIVSFDARQETVHVTQLAGDREAVGRLLEEPIRFARGEGMDVEAIVGADDEMARAAVETKGFDRVGSGPLFGGNPTVRYRLEI
ncbi:MAG: hypothetical protein V5A46_06735 [Haloferacaceae archaeon]